MTQGYSLGGSYASFFHMETVRRLGNSPFKGNIYVGDLYTFGSPRVGLNDWASAARTAMGSQTRGHAWRAANVGDPVTTIPPIFPLDANFTHLDVGWQLSPHQVPVKLPTEIGTPRRPPSSRGGDIRAHREFICVFWIPEMNPQDRNKPVLCGAEEGD
jgi:hypothetical protein